MSARGWTGTVETADALRDGRITATAVAKRALAAARSAEPGPVWIALVADAALFTRATALDALDADARAALPLFGLPFAVKDNIDVAGMRTTAACPAFAYSPATSATVVLRLEQAGALCIGKTNLDQFATGLVGTRSPYGAVPNPFDPARISGGSSSGSAAKIETQSSERHAGTTPRVLSRPGDGFRPMVLVNPAGTRPEPAVSRRRAAFPRPEA